MALPDQNAIYPRDSILSTGLSYLQQPDVLYTIGAFGIVLVVVYYSTRRRLDLDNIPSPTVWELLQLCRDVPRAYDWFRCCHEKYGPIFRFRVLHREIVMVADTTVASQILTTGPQYLHQKASEYSSLDPAHGIHGYTGMLTHMDEKIWKAHKSAVSPAYTLSAIKPLQPSMMKALVEMAKTITSNTANGSAEICIDHQVLVATIHMELESILKISVQDLKVDPIQVADDLTLLVLTCQSFLTNPIKKVIYCSPLLSQLTQGGRDFNASRQHFIKMTEDIVEQLLARGPYDDQDCSFAACLMRIEDPYRPGQKASKAAVSAEVANSFLATETVPITVAWALYACSMHPDVQDRLVAELSSAGVPVGQGPESAAAVLLKSDTMKKLVFLQAVINESMRLFPAAGPASNRVADRPVQVGPYMVPAGTYVWPCIYSIMTTTWNWDSPLQFDPDRWLSSTPAGIDPKTGATRFLPFSIGPKSCAGQKLALMEIHWAVALLLACFKFSVTPRMAGHGGVPAGTEMGFLFQPKDGIWLETVQR